MRNPQLVIESMNEKIKRGHIDSLEWPTISLAWGISGILCFYGMMDLHFPNEGWEKVVHDYLLIAKESIEHNSNHDFSLFTGLSGFSSAVYLCSQKGLRYQKMLCALDDVLIRELPFMYLCLTNRYVDPHIPIPPNFYNLAHGLSGILIYLMNREDSITLKDLAYDCIHSLVKILSGFKEVQGFKVPAWYASSEHEFIFKMKANQPKGSFKLDVPNGLSGVLAVLSLAKLKGFNVFGLNELIKKMSDWIMNKKIVQNQQMNWNYFIKMDEEVDGVLGTLRGQHGSWFYGSPGVLRSLYLASKAIQDTDLEKVSEMAFLSHLQMSLQEKEMKDISFSTGKTGLLALCYEMANDTKNPELFKQMQLLEAEIKIYHHSNHEFGFQSLLYYEKNETQWNNTPCLMIGASGIALTLLHVQGKVENNWNKNFGIA